LQGFNTLTPAAFKNMSKTVIPCYTHFSLSIFTENYILTAVQNLGKFD